MQRILVIEDEEQIRLSFIEVLEMEGYEAAGAANGEIGLAMIEEMSIDLILCDLLMPVMDGKQVLREVRANPQTADIPVIVVTAKTDPETREELLVLGANTIMKKPVALEELINTIQDCLAG